MVGSMTGPLEQVSEQRLSLVWAFETRKNSQSPPPQQPFHFQPQSSHPLSSIPWWLSIQMCAYGDYS